jgi:hypothetical protein
MYVRRIVLLGVMSVLGLSLWVIPARAMDASKRSSSAVSEKPDLHHTMEEMDDAFRTLRRKVRKSDETEDSLRLLSEMQALAVHGKSLTLELDDKTPAAERSALNKEFRLRLIDLIQTMLLAEKAVLDSDHEKAFELVKKIYEVRKEAHKRFDVDD